MRCHGSRSSDRQWLLCAVVCSAVVAIAAAGRADPAAQSLPGSLAELDHAFTAAAALLATSAANGGHADLAKAITEWNLPAAGERQIVVSIATRLEKPSSVNTPDEETIWRDFCAARRTRAAGLFEHAVAASRLHDHVPTRDELARPVDPHAPCVPQRSCEAIRLLFLCLRDDPNHERARMAGGWVKRGGDWLWPEAARRLDKGEAYDPTFGWLPKAKLERHRAGERLNRGRWITATEDAKTTRDVKYGREFLSDHWEIVSAATVDDTAALALRLEETADVWRQVFGAFAFEPKDLEKRLAGRGRTAPHTPHSAILCADRGQYLQELGPLEPLIGRTNGIYWTPTKTIWFFIDKAGDAAEPDPITIHHEATHQLFAESRHDTAKVRQPPGERCGFWAIEAAGCYLETIRSTPYGWTVGGRDAGRVPAAKERLDEGFFVPLAEISGLGRQALQADERLPQLYSQFAGLADFFMNGSGGRHREAFVEYLVRVYSGTADPDTLSRLCKQSYADLDVEYRRHLSR